MSMKRDERKKVEESKEKEDATLAMIDDDPFAPVFAPCVDPFGRADGKLEPRLPKSKNAPVCCGCCTCCCCDCCWV